MRFKLSCYDLGYSLLYQEQADSLSHYAELIELITGLTVDSYEIRSHGYWRRESPWMGWNSVDDHQAYRIEHKSTGEGLGYFVYQAVAQ